MSSDFSCECLDKLLVLVRCLLLKVDYGSTAEELESHFHGCGAVSRVTILCDKFTGHPKGSAFLYPNICSTTCVLCGFYQFFFTCQFFCKFTNIAGIFEYEQPLLWLLA